MNNYDALEWMCNHCCFQCKEYNKGKDCEAKLKLKKMILEEVEVKK